MKLKNNLTTSYFSYAIYSVFFTALLFIVFGANGWGPAAENEQAIGEISRWCERVSGGFFREPSNTLGNLGFVAVGLYMFYKLSDDATNNKFPMFGSFKIALLYAAASTFLGPGSMAMHGTHTKIGAWIDNVSMIAYILLLWIYNLKKLTHFLLVMSFLIRTKLQIKAVCLNKRVTNPFKRPKIMMESSLNLIARK